MLEPDPELAVAYGIFSVRQARAAGYSDADIRRSLRKGRWVRSGRGQLETVGRTPQAADSFVRGALAAGPQSVIAFESAAVLHGWDLRHPPDRVQLLRPHTATSGAGYRTQFDLGDLVRVGVAVVTSPVRTALDVAACRDFATGVITLDSALRSKQLTLTDLGRRFAATQRKGVTAARRALAAADPSSGSVPETEARLLFAAAGVPSPKTQFAVRSEGRFVARVDFSWENAKLVVEIDGFLYHSAAGDFQSDRTKQNAVQLEGWLVLRFTVADIRERPDLVVAQICRALARP